jgi:hypothetical protein
MEKRQGQGQGHAEEMSRFNFVKRAVENGTVYCLDAAGDIYEMPLPKKISVNACPASVVKKFLSKDGSITRRQDYGKII